MASEILNAIKQICSEKNIPYESVLETVEAALAVAYRKDFGNKLQNIKVEFDPETGGSKIYDEKTVVPYAPEPELTEEEKAEKAKSEVKEMSLKKENFEKETTDIKDGKTKAKPSSFAEASEDAEPEEPKFNPKTDLTLEDAQKLKAAAQIGDVIRTGLPEPEGYGRMAAQTAKQVIIQKLREAERETIYKEYQDKIGQIITGIIQRVEGKLVLVDLNKAVALMPPQEQIASERYSPGMKVKLYVMAVEKTNKGPEIVVSRAHPDMVRYLFEVEVPEIGSGAIEIKSIAREAGSRTKIAVVSTQENIDPIGSCVGQRGSRVQTVIHELNGEKIDIVEWSDDPVRFIMNALSPAKVLSVKLDHDNKVAMAEVKDDQLSLAIGKAGQNVRLSSRLTGWKIDIVKETGDPSTSSGQTESSSAEATEDAEAAELKDGEPAAEKPKKKAKKEE